MKHLTPALSCLICGCFLSDTSADQAPSWSIDEEEACFSWQVHIEGECVDLPPSGRYSYEIKSIESTCSELSDESLEKIMNFSSDNMAIEFRTYPGEEGTPSRFFMYGIYPLPRQLGYAAVHIFDFGLEGEDFTFSLGDKILGRHYIHNGTFKYDISEKKFIITANHEFLDGISNHPDDLMPKEACKETWIYEGVLEEKRPSNCIAQSISESNIKEVRYRETEYRETCMTYFPYEPLDGE